MKDAVRFNGKPEEVTLAYPTGKKCSNGSFLYTLKNDNRVLFATPALNELIQERQPYSGVRLSIQLLANKQWEVTPMDSPVAEPGAPPAGSRAVAEGTWQNPQQSNGTRKETLTQLGNVLKHGSPEGPQVPMNGQGWSALRVALLSAIDDCSEAEKYAAGKGMSIRFSSEDLRCIANTIQINMSQRGGR